MICNFEDSAEHIEIAGDHRVISRDVQIVVETVRPIIHPGKQGAAYLLIAAFEPRADIILIEVTEDLEVILENAP
ncbi:hypothetical protein G6F65_023522 [Rhizopus arrhizus]|nr:hypothetical protein G6F65_023522 [Rhizopus arrhizus]